MELAEQALPKVNASAAYSMAVSYEEVPSITKRLRASNISLPTQSALEFLILTACRTTKLLSAQWSEADLDGKLWIIPAIRMESGEPHEVALTKQMTMVLHEAAALNVDSDFVFPSGTKGRPFSNNTWRHALQKRLGINATVNGMRSAFTDWAAETTNFATKVLEMALGYVISYKVEAAYRRGNLSGKRRQLMEDWFKFLYKCDAKIISIDTKVAKI